MRDGAASTRIVTAPGRLGAAHVSATSLAAVGDRTRVSRYPADARIRVAGYPSCAVVDLTHLHSELGLAHRTQYPSSVTPLKLARFLSTTSDGTVVMHGHVLLYMWHDVANRKQTVSVKLENGRYMLRGSLTGEHSLDAGALITDAARLFAHWTGYVTAAMEEADRDAGVFPCTSEVQ